MTPLIMTVAGAMADHLMHKAGAGGVVRMGVGMEMVS